MEIEFTKHAEGMLKERKISKELVKETIMRPDWEVKEEGEIWHAFKRTGDKVLHIVVKGKREPYAVITIFFDRRFKRK